MIYVVLLLFNLYICDACEVDDILLTLVTLMPLCDACDGDESVWRLRRWWHCVMFVTSMTVCDACDVDDLLLFCSCVGVVALLYALASRTCVNVLRFLLMCDATASRTCVNVFQGMLSFTWRFTVDYSLTIQLCWREGDPTSV